MPLPLSLAARGFVVIDPAQTSNLMVRLNLNEIEVSQPQGLAKLKAQGIDATLVVRAAAGSDGEPQDASARMVDTTNGQMIAGVSWENGFGGQQGSIADRVMRKGLPEAARQIADELAAKLVTS